MSEANKLVATFLYEQRIPFQYLNGTSCLITEVTDQRFRATTGFYYTNFSRPVPLEFEWNVRQWMKRVKSFLHPHMLPELTNMILDQLVPDPAQNDPGPPYFDGIGKHERRMAEQFGTHVFMCPGCSASNVHSTRTDPVEYRMCPHCGLNYLVRQ